MTDTQNVVPVFGTGVAIPKRKGGAQAIPNPFEPLMDDMASETGADGITKDGHARTAEFGDILDRKDTNVARAWRQFGQAAAKAGFKPGRQWDTVNKGTAAKPKVVGVMTFWLNGTADAAAK